MTKDIPMQDLTPLQYEIVEFLSIKQPMMLSEISACLGISMPNMSREIKKLTEKGLCEKISDKEDRRKLYIGLTELGENRMAEAFAFMRKLFMKRIEHLSHTELEQISEAMVCLESMLLSSDKQNP